LASGREGFFRPRRDSLAFGIPRFPALKRWAIFIEKFRTSAVMDRRYNDPLAESKGSFAFIRVIGG
jgi:hypothetical protein